ncbi:hypothetical protein M3Y99_01070200 [Aphelenchoides fujianensis]|nr:hypothetical protein M3Y99_01070200 [Aphelenchoides fujianensis]
MLLILVVFFYTGLELAFIESIYPTSIGFTLALGTNTRQLLAANMIVGGVGMVGGSFLFSRTACLKREVIVAIGCAAHLAVYAGVFVNLPGNASLFRTAESSGFIDQPQVWLVLACGFLLGFADACWTTQTMAHLITWHKAESTQANSLFRFFQASAACLGFPARFEVPPRVAPARPRGGRTRRLRGLLRRRTLEREQEAGRSDRPNAPARRSRVEARQDARLTKSCS